jgi:molybdate-binding protein
MADVGFGVEPAASQFGLDFVPVVTEDYYFACERTRLNDVPLVTLLEVLRDASFKASVDRLAGYDPVECGTTLDVASGLAGSSAQESYPR